jgi:hypothetical protein
MTHDNDILDKIIKLSPVSIRVQNNWKKLHKKFVNDNTIEILTYAGLMQAVDNLAYHIYLNSKICIDLELTDEECYIVLESSHDAMEEIIRTISLSSGIHPITIDLMVGFRTDYYTDSTTAYN